MKVGIMGTMIFDNFVWIILEFVENGDLKTLLQAKKLETYGIQEKINAGVQSPKDWLICIS
jgi:hypothetical protein